MSGSRDGTDFSGRVNDLEARPINAQTGTTYTLALSDATKYITMTNGSASTLTVPSNTTAAIPVGTRIPVAQLGAGQVTVAAGSGATLRAAPTAKVLGQYSEVLVTKIATDTWLLSGNNALS